MEFMVDPCTACSFIIYHRRSLRSEIFFLDIGSLGMPIQLHPVYSCWVGLKVLGTLEIIIRFKMDFRMKSKDHNDHVTGNTWWSTYVLMSCKMAPHWWLTSDKGVQYPLLTIKETWCTSILEWDSKRQSQDCFPPMQQELVGWRVWEGTFVEWQGRCPKVSSMTTKRAIVGICNVWTCYFQFLLVTPNTLPNCIKCTWKWAQARTPSIPIFRNPHDFEELQHSEMNNNYTMYLDPPW